MSKKNDIISRIKQETELIEIKDMSNDILQKSSPTVLVKEEKKTFAFPFRFASILVTTLLLIFGIYLMVDNRDKGGNGVVNAEVSKPHQVYGLQAVTLFNFANNDHINREIAQRAIKMKKMENNTIDYNVIANEINDYLLSATDILKQDSVKYFEEESDDPKYQNKMIIKVTSFNIEKVYTLYFNEQSDKDYDDIDEVSSKIEGIIKTNDEEFYFNGEKEVETKEKEIELRMYLNDTKTNYYEVSQEMEKNETEFSYSYYVNNKLIEEVETTLIKNNNSKYIEMEIFKGKTEIEIEFRYLESYIFVTYEKNEQSYEVKVSEEIDHMLYTFKETEIKIY